jgi:hypothetical protein
MSEYSLPTQSRVRAAGQACRDLADVLRQVKSRDRGCSEDTHLLIYLLDLSVAQLRTCYKYGPTPSEIANGSAKQ